MSGVFLDFNVLINSKLGISPERYYKEYCIVIIYFKTPLIIRDIIILYNTKKVILPIKL